MSQINTFLVGVIGPLGPVAALGLAGVLLAAVGVVPFLVRRRDPMDKFHEAARRGAALPAAEPQAERLRLGAKTDKLERYASFLEPQDAEAMTSARLKMLQAGYRSKNAVRTFHAMQFALGIGALVLGVLFAIVGAGGEPSPLQMALTVILPAGAGYYLPTYWVERRRQSRQQEIINGFPDALDMMLVCVEAGQSLDQSIIRVAKEIRAGYPALAEEYEIVSQEMKAGKDRISVLRDMSERAGVPDVASFVTVLIQSATFGTSIADALRVYGFEMRDKRVMRAEEKANVLPTKLTLGTMMFTLPPLLIILIGPSVYGISQLVSKMNF